MKKRINQINILLLFLFAVSIAKAQEIKFFHKELTSFDSIKNIDDWKKQNLNNNDINTVSANNNSKLRSASSYTGWEHEEYHMQYKNIPIEYATIKIHKKDGDIKSINGEYYENIKLDITPNISESMALEKAKKYIGADLYIWEDNSERDFLVKTNQAYLLNPPKGELVICKDYIHNDNKKLCLSYKFEIYAKQPLSRSYVYVDAKNGQVIHVNSIIKDDNGSAETRYSGTRTISTNFINNQYRLRDYDGQRGNGIETFNMHNGTNYANVTDFIDNDNNWTAAEYNNANKDNAALDAHWGAMMTYDYFKEVHNRNSFDNQGSVIKNYVHYGSNYGNAFWDGHVMTYGDGNSQYDAYTSLDVIAHEIGHGVTQYTAGLVYQGQSGALNESISDIWGACVDNYAGGRTFFAIWTHDDDINLSNLSTNERFLWNPKLGGQPDTYNGTNWYTGNNNNIGIHTNSGVFNFWFYVLSNGGSGFTDFNTLFLVSGIGINKAEQILYKALTEYFTPNTNYVTAAILTTYATQEIFGFCSEEVISVKEAWKAVGINLSLNIPTNLSITNTITNGTNVVYSAINTIDASNIIEENTIVTYRAGDQITLNPGFTVNTGAHVQAYTEECTNNFINRQNRIARSASIQNEIQKDEMDIAINNPEESILSENKIIVYPNPTNSLVNIHFFKFNKTASLSIYNSIGQMILNKDITKNNFNVDLTSFKAGVYTLHITSAVTNKTIQIIKQ